MLFQFESCFCFYRFFYYFYSFVMVVGHTLKEDSTMALLRIKHELDLDVVIIKKT